MIEHTTVHSIASFRYILLSSCMLFRISIVELRIFHVYSYLKLGRCVQDDELGSKGRRGPGGRKVTPQRKKNNRKAQQRYREKRKQQAAEREEQVAVLSSQLAAMQTIQNEHAVVSSENVQLREVLLQKEAEIENLKVPYPTLRLDFTPWSSLLCSILSSMSPCILRY